MQRQGFITPLRVESIDPVNWLILSRLSWIGSKGDRFDVDEGEITDFATVPWWSQAITPRTGTWTKAAVLHDKMCNLLNEFYKLVKQRQKLIDDGVDISELESLIPPPFTSKDVDAIFRLNARDGGTGPIRSELLWVGVRSGAIANPARRGEFLQTAPRFVFDVVVLLIVLVGIIAFLSWAWPW